MKIQIALSSYLEDTNIGQVLKRFEGKGYYVHFSRIQKLGVKHKHAHSDPHGIYFYPVDWLIKAEGRKNEYGEKQSLYSQYAVTYPYYYIVKIDKSYNGITLDDLTEEDVNKLASQYHITVKNERSKLPGYSLWQSIKDKLPKDLYWVEDHSGIINHHEPSQILVRSLKCTKVVDSGYTKTDNRMSVVMQSIVKALGKPNTIKSVRDNNGKGRIKQFVLKYSKDGYTPFVVNLYESVNWQSGFDIEAETSFQEWHISGYHNGVASKYVTAKFKSEKDDSSKILATSVELQYFAYKNSNKLVEQSLASDWKQEYLRKDIDNLKEHLYTGNFVRDNGITSPFLINHVKEQQEQALANLKYDSLFTYFPLADKNNFEVYAQDFIDFHQMPQRSTVRKWKDLRAMLPEKQFEQFQSDFLSMMQEFVSTEQAKEILDYLNQ